MPTTTKTWDFTTGTLGWAFQAAGLETGSQDATNGLVVDLAGKNRSQTEPNSPQGWTITDTYVNIFGVAANDVMTQIGIANSTNFDTWLCTFFTVGGTVHSAAQLQARPKTGASFFGLAAAQNFTATTAAANNNFNNIVSGGAMSGVLGSDTVTFWLRTDLSTGNNNSAHMAVGYRTIVVTLTYTLATHGPVLLPPQRRRADRFLVMR